MSHFSSGMKPRLGRVSGTACASPVPPATADTGPGALRPTATGETGETALPRVLGVRVAGKVFGGVVFAVVSEARWHLIMPQVVCMNPHHASAQRHVGDCSGLCHLL